MNFIGGLTLLDSLVDAGPAPELAGASQVATTVIGGVVYAFVAGRSDNGIQVVRIENDAIVPVDFAIDSTAVELSGVYALDVVRVGTERFLVALAPNGNGLSTFRIETTDPDNLGNITHVQTLRDSSAGGNVPNLQYSLYQDTVTIGNKTFVVVASYSDDAVTVFEVQTDGRLVQRDAVLDSEDAAFNLAQAAAVTITQVADRTFVYVGTTGDAGLTAFELGADGRLSHVQNIDITGSRIEAMTTAESGGSTYLVVTDSQSYRILVYRVGADGSLTETDRFDTDAGGVGPYYYMYGLETLVVQGISFVVMTDEYGHNFVVYSMNEDGTLSELMSYNDPQNLEGARGISIVENAGRFFLLVAAADASAITLMEIGGGDDPVVGSLGNDALVGLNGDDDISALAGDDIVYGYNGSDVVSGRAGADTLYGGNDDDVLLGGNGDDVISGGEGADLMVGGAGRDALVYTNSEEGVVVDLGVGQGAGGQAEGDVFFGFENVTGSGFADVLTAASTGTFINGGKGNDTVNGAAGNDRFFGADGSDVLTGAGGSDTLLGDQGDDRLVGGDGDDELRGGGGKDTLEGGQGADLLRGEQGNDTLTSGAGDDRMIGGAGRDRFVFVLGDGNDEIMDFNVALDRIDLSAISQFEDFADVQAAAFTFAGDTVITIASGQTVFIANVTFSSMTADNFIL